MNLFFGDDAHKPSNKMNKYQKYYNEISHRLDNVSIEKLDELCQSIDELSKTWNLLKQFGWKRKIHYGKNAKQKGLNSNVYYRY